MIGKKDVPLVDDFGVTNAAGAKVTGIAPAAFTPVTLFDPTGTDRGPDGTNDITITISELGDGRYRTSFTPDATGDWILTVTHPTYFPEGKSNNYLVFAQLFDGISVANLGPGNRVVTISVDDADTGNPIVGAYVEVYTVDLSTKIAFGWTDSAGEIVFSLFDGSYSVILSLIGAYVFTVPESLTVSGDTAQTYEGTAFEPTSPASPDLCTVYGWNFNMQDTAVAVTIEAKLIGERNTLIAYPHIVTEDITTTSRVSDGYWEIPVIQSALYTGGETKYQFLIDGVAGPAVIVPTAASARLIDLEAAAT